MAEPKLKYKAEIDLRQTNNSHTLACDFIGELGRGGLRILEIGCAAGDVGASLRAAGHQVSGVEPDVEAARVASTRLNEVFVGTLDTWVEQASGRLFDVVLFGDVLEHLVDPAAALRLAAAHLAPGGHVVASVPNVAHASVRAMLLDGRWDLAELGILDRTHLRWFTRRTLLDLLADNGFAVARLSCTMLGLRQADRLYDLRLTPRATAIVETWATGPDSEAFQWVVLAHPAPLAGAGLRELNARVGLEFPDRRSALARRGRRCLRCLAAWINWLGGHLLVTAWQRQRQRRRSNANGRLMRAAFNALRDLNHRRLERRRGIGWVRSYGDWIDRFEAITPALTRALAARQAALAARPLISVALLPGANGWRDVAATLASLQAQGYGEYEVLLPAGLAAPVGADPQRWRMLLAQSAATAVGEQFNAALAQACGSHLIAIHSGDRLAPHALLLWAEAAVRFADAVLIYADDDCIDSAGQRSQPRFKPDWNPELLRSTDYIGAALAWRVSALRAHDLARIDLGKAWRYDLLLRLTESAPSAAMVHVPHALLHRLAVASGDDDCGDASTAAAMVRALEAHFKRCELPAEVEVASAGAWRWQIRPPSTAPKVSLIIPTRNGLKLLKRCIEGIFSATRYANFDMIVIDNGSDDPATLHYLAELRGRARIRVHRDDSAFNYSALNNAAVRMTDADYVALVNNDIEVIGGDWLEEMLGLAAMPGVGGVGARLLYPDRTVQHAGVVLGIFGIAGHVHRRLERDQVGYCGRAALTQNFSAVTAACLLIRRSTYLSVGGLDEAHLAVDYNDVDFCLRLREAGWRQVWTPNAELFHHESATRGAKRKPEQLARFAAETAWMKQRWGRLLSRDPAYNPNLELGSVQFALAAAPRVNLTQAWFCDSEAPTAEPT